LFVNTPTIERFFTIFVDMFFANTFLYPFETHDSMISIRIYKHKDYTYEFIDNSLSILEYRFSISLISRKLHANHINLSYIVIAYTKKLWFCIFIIVL
jgi:hypothetical protein